MGADRLQAMLACGGKRDITFVGNTDNLIRAVQNDVAQFSLEAAAIDIGDMRFATKCYVR